MKLKINEEYVEVDFWSFLKCNLLTSLAITGLVWIGLTIILSIIGVMIA